MFAPVVTRIVTYQLPVARFAVPYMDAVLRHPTGSRPARTAERGAPGGAMSRAGGEARVFASAGRRMTSHSNSRLPALWPLGSGSFIVLLLLLGGRNDTGFTSRVAEPAADQRAPLNEVPPAAR
jgi:hypothetical protein